MMLSLEVLSGGISAFLACILGFMLSQSGYYKTGLLDTHFWMGMGSTIIAFLV